MKPAPPARISVFASAWNQFWFAPINPLPLQALRFLVGLAATYYLVSHVADLSTWFGSHGLLPPASVDQLLIAQSESSRSNLAASPGFAGDSPALYSSSFHWSYLNYLTSNTALWTAHGAAILVLICYTLGLFPRWTAPASLIIVLSYVHRAPMIAGPFESVLTMLLAYLTIAFIGPKYSTRQPSIWANVSWRLIQLHVAALYLFIALAQLSGTVGVEYEAAWWRGEALWWLIARSESRLINFTALHSTLGTLLVNAGTHLMVAVELLFSVLIWKPLTRPMMIVAATILWVFLALVTGWVSYAVIMILATLAFLPPDRWPAWSWGVSRAAAPASHAGLGGAVAQSAASRR